MSYENPVTTDLSKFGIREIKQAAKLLNAYADSQPEAFEGGINIALNTQSGNVFITDEEYNVAMINDNGKLEQFVSCPNCGREGFINEFTKNGCESCNDDTYKESA